VHKRAVVAILAIALRKKSARATSSMRWRRSLVLWAREERWAWSLMQEAAVRPILAVTFKEELARATTRWWGSLMLLMWRKSATLMWASHDVREAAVGAVLAVTLCKETAHLWATSSSTSFSVLLCAVCALAFNVSGIVRETAFWTLPAVAAHEETARPGTLGIAICRVVFAHCCFFFFCTLFFVFVLIDFF